MSKLNKALMATTAIAFAAGLAMPAAAKKKDPSKAPKVVSSGKKNEVEAVWSNRAYCVDY